MKIFRSALFCGLIGIASIIYTEDDELEFRALFTRSYHRCRNGLFVVHFPFECLQMSNSLEQFVANVEKEKDIPKKFSKALRKTVPFGGPLSYYLKKNTNASLYSNYCPILKNYTKNTAIIMYLDHCKKKSAKKTIALVQKDQPKDPICHSNGCMIAIFEEVLMKKKKKIKETA